METVNYDHNKFYDTGPRWQLGYFCNFYLVKNHKIANNSTNTKTKEKISAQLESLEF